MKNYQDFCNQISTKLFQVIEENDSLLQWKQKWTVNGSNVLPFGKSGLYRGGNLFSLLLAQVENGFTSNQWMTFKQIQQLGGSVLKGAKSEVVYFWRQTKINEIFDGEEIEKIIPVFRTYRVFNIDQSTLKNEFSIEKLNEKSIIEIIEKLQIKISTFGNQPHYHPSEDVIVMPNIGSFDTENDYHLTLLHEMIHATGHKSRLNRISLEKYKIDKQRAEEELVAEIGSLFLATYLNLDGDLLNHASYVADWKQLLEQKDILRAIKNAVMAFEYLIS